MDGDLCPLSDLIHLSKQYNAHLIIDEAHAIGVVGKTGEGLSQARKITGMKFSAGIYTLGKACGCHGAVVTGSQQLKDYLINFARSLIYTTALPEHSVAAIQASYNTFPFLNNERRHLQQLIQYFQQAELQFEKLSSPTPIQIVIIPGNDAIKLIARQLQEAWFRRPPDIIPDGTIRQRKATHCIAQF
jgi:8-amino-7-oxononanoate synthase